MRGISLRLSHSNLPSCGDCKQTLYDKDWKPVQRRGEIVPRPAGTPTPCVTCPKCRHLPLTERKPENAAALSPKNEAAYWYYLQCREDPRGELTPRDAITLRNNALIRQTLDDFDRAQANIAPLFMALFGGKK